MKKKKIYSLRVLGETISKNIRDDDFYTTDTDTWLEFSLVDKTLIPETMSISLVNSNDGSAINEVVTLTETKTILFRLDPEIIVHAGTWQGQVVFEANGEMYTSKSFAFGVLSNVMDNNVPQLIKIANFKHFKQMLEELTQQGEVFEENELARESAETERINAESSRASTESGRVLAEQTRVSAESIRAEFYEGFDGRLDDLEADKVVLNNSVINGDFSNGTIGWTSTGGTVTESNNVLNYEVSSLQTLSSFIEQNIPMATGDILYVTYSLYPLYATRTQLYVKSYYNVENIIPNQWNKITMRVEVGEGTASAPRFVHFTNTEYAIGDNIQYKDIQLINLTQTFGVGNEPTKEWMDRLIEQTGYFDEHILNENLQVGEMVRLDNTKANKQQEDWITPTLINGATGSLMYRKNQFNGLQLKGTLNSVGSTDFGTVCQLPTEYRPPERAYVGAYDSASVSVAVNGYLYCRSNKTGNTTVYFDGISIPLD